MLPVGVLTILEAERPLPIVHPNGFFADDAAHLRDRGRFESLDCLAQAPSAGLDLGRRVDRQANDRAPQLVWECEQAKLSLKIRSAPVFRNLHFER